MSNQGYAMRFNKLITVSAAVLSFATSAYATAVTEVVTVTDSARHTQ